MIITTDLSLPEGPIPLEDGAWLVTELDTRRGTVVRITRDGVREPIAKTGRPNGLAMASDGTVWVAESLEPSIIHLDLSGEFTRELYEARVGRCSGRTTSASAPTVPSTSPTRGSSSATS